MMKIWKHATLLVIIIACSSSSQPIEQKDWDFNSYWSQGKAEITTYELTQARYGELREGTAVTVFVTEPWNANAAVKSDSRGDFQVMKLNLTKKFLTGIYPYSMMTSAFTSVENQDIQKITTTSQEWCGHTFTQVNSENDEYQLKQFSYFESEGDDEAQLSANGHLEDEVWNLIRLNPEALPQGEIMMLPPTMYLRMSHQDLQYYKANALLEIGDKVSRYILEYPGLRRTISIRFNTAYPHTIESWKESYPDGYGQPKILTTEAKLKNREMLDYWNLNKNSDLFWREELGLD
ncbi:MAG: septum formation inhibitor Maf [Flavobacteriales bacterium]|nr:septum formation inhibitor Maf [Flavobacteriales bacterium]